MKHLIQLRVRTSGISGDQMPCINISQRSLTSLHDFTSCSGKQSHDHVCTLKAVLTGLTFSRRHQAHSAWCHVPAHGPTGPGLVVRTGQAQVGDL